MLGAGAGAGVGPGGRLACSVLDKAPAGHRAGAVCGRRRRRPRRCGSRGSGSCPAWRRQAVQQGQHLLPGFLVQVAGRLVGQDEQRVVGQGAGNRDALLLSAREAIGEGLQRSARPTASSSGCAGARRRAVSMPFSSSGRTTFSSTVSVGIRLKNWKTKPMFARRKRVRCARPGWSGRGRPPRRAPVSAIDAADTG